MSEIIFDLERALERVKNEIDQEDTGDHHESP
jgi:hypothetical protein